MELLKHECGVAMIRLLKPLEYYQEKYGTWMYGLNKLYLLMEKQHNRGQEGAGLACVKMEASPGEEYLFRERALGTGAITEIFSAVQSRFKDISAERLSDAAFARRHLPFAGEMYMGHLRYSTTGKSGLSFVHPFLRRNNWRAKNLALCGNFNLTNVDEVFASITAQGQHPRIYSDTYIMLEQVGHRLDRECERLYAEAVSRGLEGTAVTEYIEERVDVNNVLRTAAPLWDGGYVVCGLTGSGEMFAMRDPWGIRPAFWYQDDEVVVVASERPVIQTVFALEAEQIHELQPGQALSVRGNGETGLQQIIAPKTVKACSFERIYFSRGSDRDIYRERKALGRQLRDDILRDGIYNQNLQAVPPTGSISYINHSTSSIHPIASKIEIRKEGKLGRVYYPAAYMTNDNLEYYKDAYEIGWKAIVDTYAEATQHVDQGLSLTLFFPDTATTRDLNKAQIYAWRKGIKTLYYIRIRQQALEGTEVQGCVSCML